MNYICRGRLRYLMGGNVCDIQQGEFAIFWAGIPHKVIEEAEFVEGIWLTLPLDWLLQWRLPGHLTESLLAGQLIRDRAPHAVDHTLEEAQMRRWARDYDPQLVERNEVLRLEVEARIRRLAFRFDRSTPAPALPLDDARMRKFAEIIDSLTERYQEDITVDDIARDLHMHPKYLMRFFKKTAGMTVLNYLLRLRLAHAQRLLLTTDCKVIDAAYDAGFQSLSSFYHAYAKHHGGEKPAALRRRLAVGSNGS